MKNVHKNREKIVEELAKILSKIHGHCLRPFYEASDFFIWSKIEEKTKNPNLVDKEFFRKMARFILKKI